MEDALTGAMARQPFSSGGSFEEYTALRVWVKE